MKYLMVQWQCVYMQVSTTAWIQGLHDGFLQLKVKRVSKNNDECRTYVMVGMQEIEEKKIVTETTDDSLRK